MDVLPGVEFDSETIQADLRYKIQREIRLDSEIRRLFHALSSSNSLASVSVPMPALGRLDAISTLLPDAKLFLYSYVRKEAVMSLQIEGAQSSMRYSSIRYRTSTH